MSDRRERGDSDETMQSRWRFEALLEKERGELRAAKWLADRRLERLNAAHEVLNEWQDYELSEDARTLLSRVREALKADPAREVAR